ncbi:hypothetical protein SDC9_137848 [bioreactor metagenome]|uniref:Uncharacterized protein n=1 Tax=bioreactor metagenome TaxID=1076179 RepID=A0A645DN57_9ZZZZ
MQHARVYETGLGLLLIIGLKHMGCKRYRLNAGYVCARRIKRIGKILAALTYRIPERRQQYAIAPHRAQIELKILPNCVGYR